MSTITKPNTFSANTTISSSEMNANFDTIYNEFNGSISASNLATSAVTTTKILDSNVTTAKIADASVTPAKWTNPYCFRAYASSTSTTLTDATAVAITFDAEDYDYNSNFASSTYTAPVAGVYHFDAMVTHASLSSAPVAAYTSLYKNGSEAASGGGLPGSTAYLGAWTISADLLLAVNDTVRVYHYQNSAGNEASETGSEFTYFNGHLIHPI